MLSASEYQELSREYAVFPDGIPEEASDGFMGLMYCALKLNGEAGELAEHVGKMLRDDGGKVTQERARLIYKEVGDNLWYLARICDYFNWTLDGAMAKNLEKLAARAEAGTLQGDGDDR